MERKIAVIQEDEETMWHERWLARKVKSLDGDFTPDKQLYRFPFDSPGYHTQIREAEYVHATYPNAVAAVALLDSRLAAYEERAFGILEKLISLQDTDRNSPTFGIWSWFEEEPLAAMSPPDWNWADFIGKNFVLVLARHAARLPAELARRLMQSLMNAADAIMQRDVGPSYTNIAIMGAFVTLIGGEWLGNAAYERYGLARLERFLAFTRRLNTFQEYNSPAYATITILELSRLKSETSNERAKEICDELLELAWSMIADHYHAPTGEWSGPHSRSYGTLLKPSVRSFLQLGTRGAASYVPWEELDYSTEWYKSGIACPARHLDRFRTLQRRSIREVYQLDETRGIRKLAATDMTSEYAIGSFSREIMWTQCRSLVGYFDGGAGAVSMRLRFLLDEYDFSSALLTADQAEGQILFGLNWFTNGGNTHPVLDKTNGVIETSDLRIRLEFGGCLEQTTGEQKGHEGVDIQVGNKVVSMRLVHGVFEEEGSEQPMIPSWQLHRDSTGLYADYVIYSGPRREFDMAQIRRAIFIFALAVGGEEPECRIDVREDQGEIGAEGKVNGRRLAIHWLHVKPKQV
ncbi:hypothetical protein [Paenibacillus methanolicus]|uniref:Heparinase II/III-like protein n=1 Tax=Paenibacillus methanolicus TaxID=582686 RepID=A0A5S5CAZ0_9BACL|nr:hypothetical protein [Paenibacillus methanolicus]TYP76487.1 hypothetical protein BCM02_103149 [Paenibacillus methanolicus]